MIGKALSQASGWIALALVIAPRPALSQAVAAPGAKRAPADAADWLSYNRTLAGDRFSPLAEITRSNVSRLRSVCTYTLPEVTSLQTGPLVVGGAMYFTTDTISYAIDASTCAEKWKQVRRVLWQTDAGQSTGGGIVTYVAGGRQLLGVAAGMKSPVWPGGAEHSRILVFGLR